MVISLKRKLLNENGSTLVLLVIIIAVIIFIGISLLNITMSQYKIKKSNSEVKKALYVSETGLNKVYVRVYDLISEAMDDSINKADEYLFINSEDLNGASLLFINNYKQYIINNVISTVYDSNNPYTDVTNKVNLAFISDKLTTKISSKYISNLGIEKITTVDIVISVPDYVETKSGMTKITQLMQFINFNM